VTTPWGEKIMIITHHREKMINAICYFACKTQFCGKIKLLKLLYFLDFRHFRQTGRSVTGLQYSAWQFGPVPDKLYNELSETMPADLSDMIQVVKKGDFHQIVPKKSFCKEWFTNREIKIMDDLIYIFKDSRAEDMVESTHLKHTPWDKTIQEKGQFSHIDYMLILDDEPDSLTYEEAVDQVNNREEMIRAFGGC
jgi:uncharacterized phage-associated protein